MILFHLVFIKYGPWAPICQQLEVPEAQNQSQEATKK